MAIVAIGFLLGMRHATDPGNIIAVSTIASRQRSIFNAGLIGVLWGLGHTLTILLVGAAIIVLGLAIPVRVGLAMELCVGLMLILLGVLNLNGAMKWLGNSPPHTCPSPENRFTSIAPQSSPGKKFVRDLACAELLHLQDKEWCL